jgi:ubiquinone biosynthesis protein COQ9
MARDPKNYYQETWRQIRNKIKKFKNIPEQYSKYMESQKKQSAVESN